MTALSIPEVPDDTDVLAAAFAYTDAGWYVLPVRMDTKHPGSVVGAKWQTKSSRDPKQIAAWFAGTDHSIALHCGRSGAVVFDVDDYDKTPDELLTATETSDCPYQSTRPDQQGRGHYVFAMPPGRMIGNSGGRLGGAWGEVRGTNGVIIAAPSVHPEGGHYQWVRSGEIPVLPDDLAEMLDDASPAEDAATDAVVASFLAEHVGNDRPDALQGLMSALRTKIAEGESRHQSLPGPLAGAMKEARAGKYPAQTAADAMRSVFLDAVAKPPASGKQSAARTGPVARSEFGGILAWAVGQALAADLNEVNARLDEKMPDNVEVLESLAPAAPAMEVVLRSPAERTQALIDAHAVFRKWLGEEYDLDGINVVLAAAAVEQLGGDPLWLLLVSGSGNAKTETAQSLQSQPNTFVISTISSPGALLSATSKRDKTKDATGGLLREIGPRGVLVIKDVTSIISQSRELRGEVLAALREIYDGYWSRNVGTDGGQTLDWKGRLVVVGAVTTAWDSAHAVVASMGDRFVLLRLDSTTGRQAAGRRAIGNTGSETQMRAELAEAVAHVLRGSGTDPADLDDDDRDLLLAAADLVTLARTGVEFDYRGDVIDAHAPEMPTRFAKQLAQVVRGGEAVGMGHADAMRLAIRCARDSMPPMRLAIIDYLDTHPQSTTSDVRKGIDKPRSSVDRQLQALHMLGVLDCFEEEDEIKRPRWRYSIRDDIGPESLVVPPKESPDLSVGAYATSKTAVDDGSPGTSLGAPSDKSGDSLGHVCTVCREKPLWAPESIERGICDGCRVATERRGA